MADPLNLRAVNALIARLQAIAVINGYATNAGLRVFHGRRELQQGDLPCIVVFEGEESAGNTPAGAVEANGTTQSMVVRLTLTVEGYVLAQPAAEGPGLSRLKADIKKAALDFDAPSLVDVDGPIGPLSYTGASPLLRADGTAVEGVQLTFVARLTEGYGNPFASR